MSGFHCFSSFIFNTYTLNQNNVAQELNFIVNKLTLFQIYKEDILLKLIKNLPKNSDMAITLIFGINQSIVQVHNNKYVKFLSQNLIVVVLKVGWSVRVTKKYYLVLKMTVSSLESHFLFDIFFNPYLIIYISQIWLSQLPEPA